MRIRWSQLVYRIPGGDNAAGLAKVLQTPDGEVLCFQDRELGYQESEVGYLAMLPLSRGMEEELDEWIEIDPEAFLERDHSLWELEPAPPEEQLREWWQTLCDQFAQWCGLRGAIERS